MASIKKITISDSTWLYWSGRQPGKSVTGIYATYALPEKQSQVQGFNWGHRVLALRDPHFISAFDRSVKTNRFNLISFFY